jgi:hypothetical protein
MVSLFSLRVLEIIEMPTVFEIFQNQKMTQEQSVYPDIALYVSISASQSVSRNSEGHMKCSTNEM